MSGRYWLHRSALHRSSIAQWEGVQPNAERRRDSCPEAAYRPRYAPIRMSEALSAERFGGELSSPKSTRKLAMQTKTPRSLDPGASRYPAGTRFSRIPFN